MKLTTLLITLSILSVSARTLAQKVTLHQKNVQIDQVLNEISKQTGYNVVYDENRLKAEVPVTIDVNDVQLKEVLEKLFNGRNLEYTVANNSVIIKAKQPTFIDKVKAAFAAYDAHGRVIDSLGQALPGATVKLKNGSGAATTDKDGFFTIKNVNDGDILVISFIGYQTTEIPAKVELGYIRLKEATSALDQVKIIGYGFTTQRLSTGNSQGINAKAIEGQNVNNPILALQGRIAGIEVNQVAGTANSRTTVRIRGINSFSQGNAPLYVVDGVPYASDFGTPTINSIGGTGIDPLSLINPTDIQSINVLKDADATAIYGSRGANGVILITTKKGHAGNTQISLNAQTGVGQVTRMANLMNTEEYLQMRKQAFKNDGLTPNNTTAPDLLVFDQNKYTDWQNVMIGGTAHYTNIQTSISGGSTNTQYLIGANYHKENSVFPTDYPDSKITLHFNINNTGFNNRLHLSLSSSYLNDFNQLPQTDYTSYMLLAPNAPDLVNSDGSFNWSTYSNSNPFAEKNVRYFGKTDNLTSNGIISYAIMPGLEAKIALGYNSIWINERKSAAITASNPNKGVATGSSSFTNSFIQSWITEPQLNYKLKSKKGDLQLLVGATVQQRSTDGQMITGLGYTEDAQLPSLAGAGTITKGNSSYERYKYNSLYGRVSYNWNDTYILNLTGRRDGSSRFGPGKQYGNFGAVGFAWLFSNEKFFQSLSNIFSLGKLRFSYGTSGNEPGSSYAYLERYNITTSPNYGGGTGAVPINLPANDYRWEVNKKAEIGLEIGLLKDRINFTGSFYRNRSSNQIVEQTLPNSTGFYSVTTNLPALIENRGIELTISTLNIQSNHFEWSTNFNFTANRNKLIDFPDFEASGYQGQYTIGSPLNSIRVYRFANINPTTKLYQFYSENGSVVANPSVTTDRLDVVDINPKYFGGFQNTFKYKGISLDALFQFVKQTGSNYLYSSSISPGRYNARVLSNQPAEIISNDQVQKYSTSNASSTSYNFAKSSGLAYSDASFIRLKNVVLAYEFSNNFSKKLGLHNLRLNLQGQNIFTITKYKGTDPEVQSIAALPPLKIFTAGIQVTF